MVERRRLTAQPLFVAFVDVRKAFPTVKREILFHKLAALGASDALIRAMWSLYDRARGTVRGADGYGGFFDLSVGTREGGVESPLLYVLFVADLIAELEQVSLKHGAVELGGVLVRALQFADDLAIVANSAEDLQTLLDCWGLFCDKNHQETQVRKTEIVIFAPPTLSASLQDSLDALTFCYKTALLEISAHFVYLGVWLDATLDATSSYEYREGLGWKALGALHGTLRSAPFLPLSRVAEVANSIVGGGYCYGAELWGAFVPTSGSRVSRAHMGLLLGFGSRIRVQRTYGWIPACNLDLEALSRSVRVVSEAAAHPDTLLGRAVKQLHCNWASAGKRRGRTWLGHLLSRVSPIWPSFAVSVRGDIIVRGVPPVTDSEELTVPQRFKRDAVLSLWRTRRQSLLAVPPDVYTQDFLMWCLVSSPELPADSVILPLTATVDAGRFRTLLRVLAGLEDYARVNGHYARRARDPALATPELKRACVSCWMREQRIVLDSEWHGLLECKVGAQARRRFKMESGISAQVRHHIFKEHRSNVRGLVRLVALARADVTVLDALARLAAAVQGVRAGVFRSLASRAGGTVPEP